MAAGQKSSKKFVELKNSRRANARTYIYPSFGLGNYQEIGRDIINSGFVVPTGEDIPGLVSDAYLLGQWNDVLMKLERDAFGPIESLKSIIKGFFPRTQKYESIQNSIRLGIYVFQRNLWASEGFFSLKDRNAIGRSELLEVPVLENMLKGGTEIKGTNVRVSKDGELRFAPAGSYSFGEQAPQELAQDGAIIAQYGLEGAKILAEASFKLPENPITHGLVINDGQSPEQRISILIEHNRGLNFLGNGWGENKSCSVGLLAPKTKSFFKYLAPRLTK